MLADQSERVASSIVEFCRFLREHGLSADMRKTLTALEAVKLIDVEDDRAFAISLQAALCSTGEEWNSFPELFEEFWSERQSKPRPALNDQSRSSGDASRTRAGSTVFPDQPGNDSTARDSDSRAVYGASAQQRLKKVDFSEVPHDDLPALEELSLRLLRRMSLRLSRRLRTSNRIGRVDLRRSIRRSISHGGEPIALAYKSRKPRKTRLVILLDISGSMNFYSLFLIRFAYVLQICFKRVDTFLFSTVVTAISDLLHSRHLHEALRALSQRAAGWSGGTKIGESLRQFNELHATRLLSRDTVFIILSDGWDTGEPEFLTNQLRTIKRRVQRVVWLNPLLGLKEYQPITRGMAAALPYVDVFAPAHNLESLLALERHL
jgi:uncharacterized protein with von Willebrand factor type A (vWA) domain